MEGAIEGEAGREVHAACAHGADLVVAGLVSVTTMDGSFCEACDETRNSFAYPKESRESQVKWTTDSDVETNSGFVAVASFAAGSPAAASPAMVSHREVDGVEVGLTVEAANEVRLRSDRLSPQRGQTNVSWPPRDL